MILLRATQCHRWHLADAKPRPGTDPTGTAKIRTAFSRDLDKRWATVKRVVAAAFDPRNDILGLRTIPIAPNVVSIDPSLHRLPGSDRVASFRSWLDDRLSQVVTDGGGMWVATYIRKALNAGSDRALSLTKSNFNVMSADRAIAETTLAASELQGICDALLQQATRSLAKDLLTGTRPAKIARNIAALVDSIGRNRGRMLVSYSIIKTFNGATLDGLRRQGVTRVNTVAEKLRAVKGPHGKHLVGDADVDLSVVEVLTAGDELVCQLCQDISDDGPYDLDDAEGLIPAHINCMLPGAIIEGAIVSGSKASYAGPAVEIETLKGHRICLTINHPILTSLGLLAAQDVREGMKLFCKGNNVGVVSPGIGDYDYDAPALVEDVFDAMSLSGIVALSPSRKDFHGDAIRLNGKVNIVCADRRLLRHVEAQVSKAVSNFLLPMTQMAEPLAVGASPSQPFLHGMFPPGGCSPRAAALPDYSVSALLPDGLPLKKLRIGMASKLNTIKPEVIMENFSTYSALFLQLFQGSAGKVSLDQVFSLSSLEDVLRFTRISKQALNLAKASIDRLSAYAGFIYDLVHGQACSVERDEVTKVRNFDFCGHVYDLQSTTGHIIANNLVISNCRCAFIPYNDLRFAPVEKEE